jgi:hypothetical protein
MTTTVLGHALVAAALEAAAGGNFGDVCVMVFDLVGKAYPRINTTASTPNAIVPTGSAEQRKAQRAVLSYWALVK